MIRTFAAGAAVVFCLSLWANPSLAEADMSEVRQAISEQRYFDAFEDLLDLAEDGDPEAQFELAGFYHYGRIGAANFDKALGWYRRAANQGNADAMIGLAVMFGHAQGVERDAKLAYQWLLTASLADKPPEGMGTIQASLADLKSALSIEEIASAEAAAKAFAPQPE